MRNDLTPTGYAIKHTPRPTGKGGGVAIIYKSGLSTRKRTAEVFRTFEHFRCTLKTCKSSIRTVVMYRPPPYVVMYRPPPYVVMYRPPPYVVMYRPPPYVVMYRPPPYVVMYRPPPSAKNGLTTSAFCEECGRFIDQHVLQFGQIIVIDKADSDARRLTSSLDSTGMAMLVRGSTHRKGHTLDVLLTRCTDEHLVRNVAITYMGISDHSAKNAARRGCSDKDKESEVMRNKCGYF